MSRLHDPPDPPELLLSVREFLSGEALASLEGRQKFHMRVAINILEIVARQLEIGPANEAAHRARLAGLGFADDAALSRAIRAGALDDRYDEVAESVRQDVWDKVGVVNPHYRDPYRSPGTAKESPFTTEP